MKYSLELPDFFVDLLFGYTKFVSVDLTGLSFQQKR